MSSDLTKQTKRSEKFSVNVRMSGVMFESLDRLHQSQQKLSQKMETLHYARLKENLRDMRQAALNDPTRENLDALNKAVEANATIVQKKREMGLIRDALRRKQWDAVVEARVFLDDLASQISTKLEAEISAQQSQEMELCHKFGVSYFEGPVISGLKQLVASVTQQRNCWNPTAIPMGGSQPVSLSYIGDAPCIKAMTLRLGVPWIGGEQ